MKYPRFLPFVLIPAVLMLVVIVATADGQPASASHNAVTTSIGMDTEVSDNTATSLGSVDTCTIAPNVGDQVEIDLYVQNVADLNAYQLRIGYDSTVLKVTAVNAAFLLDSNPGSALFNLIDPLPDSDGILTMASTDIGVGAGENGSGVLARITFEAVGAGTSDITYIVDATAPKTPALFDTTPAAIGDLDADTIFDGDRLNAAITVEVDCPPFTLNELLVSFLPGTSQATIDSIISGLGTKVLAFLPELDVYWLQVVSGASVLDTAALFLQQLEVEFAEPDFIQEPRDHQTDANDPGYTDSEHWHLTNVGQRIAPDNFSPGVTAQQGIIDVDVDAPQAWDIGVSDCRGPDAASPLRIAIIDDGIDDNGASNFHSDIDGNLDLANSRNTVTNVAGDVLFGRFGRRVGGGSHGW